MNTTGGKKGEKKIKTNYIKNKIKVKNHC